MIVLESFSNIAARYLNCEEIDSFSRHLFVAAGEFRDVPVNLFTIMRDEEFLCPAFFDHYRRIGVDQFIVLDDYSRDGTTGYLSAQPDCVVLNSDIRFGDSVFTRYPGCFPGKYRWGSLVKSVIPRNYLMGKHALYVDADEFLILPDEIKIQDIFQKMLNDDDNCIAANLIEFYPERISDLSGAAHPKSFSELISLYPYFDGHPLISVRDGKQAKEINRSVSDRLFRNLRIRESRTRNIKATSPVIKTPFVNWKSDVWLNGCHVANVAPSAKVILSLAHFKFTHDFKGKIERAIKWKSHHSLGAKYEGYRLLFEEMERYHYSFFCPATRRFEGPEQLYRLGMSKWER